MFHKRGLAAAKHCVAETVRLPEFERRTTHVAVSVDQSRRVLTSR